VYADNTSGPGGAARQAAALRSEGVHVETDSMGEMYIDLERYGWFPKRLPNEEGQSSDEETEEAASGAEVNQGR